MTLARLDEDGYKRAVLRDADSILENIIFPMSFPWAHRIAPVVRNIPRDIDEMLAIQRIDDAEHEFCSIRHSNFDLNHYELSLERTGSFEADQSLEAAARRGDEPGVIELIVSAPPPTIFGGDPSGKAPISRRAKSILLANPMLESDPILHVASTTKQEEYDLNVPGEVSYRIFEQVQENKRRKLRAGMLRRKTLKISVKVDSTSSRSSLFEQNEELPRYPMLLRALLSYDNRGISHKSKNAPRVGKSRAQLVWVEQSPTNSANRYSYSSYLTCEKIEPGLHKRPREVSVGIRVNNVLLTSDTSLKEALEEQNLSKRKREGKSGSLYDIRKVNEALDVAFTPIAREVGTRQCQMDTEDFVGNILSREMKREKSMGWNRKVSIKNLNILYVTPRIDCLPTEDGLIHVVCTSHGELQPTNVSSLLNHASRKKSPLCTICWLKKNPSGESVVECIACGVLFHPSCCRGVENSYHQQWKCTVCSQIPFALSDNLEPEDGSGGTSDKERGSRRSTRTPSRLKDGSSSESTDSLKCVFCPHTGGSMSMLEERQPTVWAHDLCRTWCNQVTDQRIARFSVCALCGAGNPGDDPVTYSGLTKCAATGCSIYFHPMCALFLSKCEEYRHENTDCSHAFPSVLSANNELSNATTKSTENHTTYPDRRLEKLRKNDDILCRQYTLSFANCTIPENDTKSPNATICLPVCFCGIHNPKRDRGFYGLYPGGTYMDEHAMRVPPKKAVTDSS